MAKRIADAADAAESAGTAITPEPNKSGFYMYIGPNIRYHIQTGTIYRGDRDNALRRASSAIEMYPLVKTLIVSGDALPEARRKVKTPGTALYANYKQLVKKVRD